MVLNFCASSHSEFFIGIPLKGIEGFHLFFVVFSVVLMVGRIDGKIGLVLIGFMVSHR